MKKVTVVYKDTDVDPTETIKYEAEVENADEAVNMLKIVAGKLRDEGMVDNSEDVY